MIRDGFAVVKVAVAVVVMGLAGAGWASAQESLPIDVEAGASREVLSGGQDPWEDYWVRATLRPAPGTYAYGGVRHTRRFGQEDQQFEVGGGVPLAEHWSVALDGTWSPTQRVLPIWGVSGRVTHRLSPEWSMFAGGGRQVWEATGVNRQHAGLEHHVHPFRIGYTLGLHQIDTGGNGVRHSVHGGWAYDARGSTLTVGLATGREGALVGPRDVQSVSERSAWIWGTHWIDARTGIGYSFGVFRHGDFFTRTSSSVGVRHRL